MLYTLNFSFTCSTAYQKWKKVTLIRVMPPSWVTLHPITVKSRSVLCVNVGQFWRNIPDPELSWDGLKFVLEMHLNSTSRAQFYFLHPSSRCWFWGHFSIIFLHRNLHLRTFWRWSDLSQYPAKVDSLYLNNKGFSKSRFSKLSSLSAPH